MSETQRKKWIDFVKCIAILIVLLNHSQLDLPVVKFWGGMFFVPVFFVLSGFTHRTSKESFFVVWGRKAKRLLVPYIAANGILFVFFFVKDVVFGAKSFSEMYVPLFGILYSRNQLFNCDNQTLFLPKAEENIYFMTCLNSPTWFLTALFVTIMFFEAMLRVTKRDGRKMLLGAVILLCMANLYHYLFPVLLPWSLDAVPYFLIFFLWGYFMARKDYLGYFDRHKWILFLLLGIFLLFAMTNGSVNYSVAGYGRSAMMALYNALVSSTLVMYISYKAERFIPKLAALVGRQSMWILCCHLFVFEVLYMIFPEMWPGISILVTTAFLTAVGVGKERLLHGKK